VKAQQRAAAITRQLRQGSGKDDPADSTHIPTAASSSSDKAGRTSTSSETPLAPASQSADIPPSQQPTSPASTTAQPASASLAAASSSPSSSVMSLIRSGLRSVSSLAGSALYWTLGPFEPYQPPSSAMPTVAEASATAAEPGQPPPPPPPVWRDLHRIVVIGIHGWSLMGGLFGDRPAIVSTKFTQMFQRSLARFMESVGRDTSTIQVLPIALHGYGKVEARVEAYLNTQLPKYKEHIQTADAIFVVAHSQGVLVSVSLLHQLILQGWVNPSVQHVSMQLMAGLHHGPFPDLPWDYYDATKELFSYANVETDVHRRYMIALHFLLENAVKILCVGSAHDQVVPLYSSLLQSFPSSPNLLRAVYVDFSNYNPHEFLYALLSLCVYMMNSGVHGRIPNMVPRGSGTPAARGDANTRPTSSSTSGSKQHSSSSSLLPFAPMYPTYVEALIHLSGFLRGGLLEKNGGAHSAVHRLTDVYNLGVEWSLSGRGQSSPVIVHSHSFALWAPQFNAAFTASSMNRYLLNVRMRELFAMLPFTKLNAEEELARLHYLYSNWQPRLKHHRLLKESLATVFEVSPSLSPTLALHLPPASSTQSSAGAEQAKAAQSVIPASSLADTDPLVTESTTDSSSTMSSASASSTPSIAPLSESLRFLLKPQRLPVLSTPTPSAWCPTTNVSTGDVVSTIAPPAVVAQQNSNKADQHKQPRGRTSASSSSASPSPSPSSSSAHGTEEKKKGEHGDSEASKGKAEATEASYDSVDDDSSSEAGDAAAIGAAATGRPVKPHSHKKKQILQATATATRLPASITTTQASNIPLNTRAKL